jgi:hypothetical protein
MRVARTICIPGYGGGIFGQEGREMKILMQGVHAIPQFIHVGYCSGANLNGFNQRYLARMEKEKEARAAVRKERPTVFAVGSADPGSWLLPAFSILLVGVALIMLVRCRRKARAKPRHVRPAAGRYRGEHRIRPPVFTHAIQKAP